MSKFSPTDWQIYDASGRRKYLNEDEVLRFLGAADRLPVARRALCYLLAYTGCRISEALSICRHQFDMADSSVVLATLKRRRTFYRRVPLPDFLLRWLLALPVGTDGQLWSLHRSTAWRFIMQVMRQAGIVGAMATIRGLRHAFGMRCAGQGTPPSLIQRWMGHATLRMTMVYLEATGTEERRFASRIWWPVAALTPPILVALPGGTPKAASSHEQALRQEINTLRRENDRLHRLCHAVVSAAHQMRPAC